MKTRPWIGTEELDEPNSIDAHDAIQAASFVLYSLTGQKYAGLQNITEQYYSYASGAPVGYMVDPRSGRMYHSGLGLYAYASYPSERSTRLAHGSMFRLHMRPVVAITRVEVRGVEMDLDEFTLFNNEIVAHTGSWSLTDNPVVSYTYGVEPPALGKMACRQLANELVKAASGDSSCALPANVTSVSRQGLSFEIFDPQNFMDKGRTGLYLVDLFIASANPGKAKKRPRVFSPDVARGYSRRLPGYVPRPLPDRLDGGTP